MLNTHAERIHAIRQLLKEKHLDAFIVPHEDEFLGEYIPAHNERLHWLTGFSGSAGAAVITHDRAAIFVDGRYTVQVRKQVDANVFEYRHFVDEPITDWLKNALRSSAKIAIDAKLHSANWLDKAKTTLESTHELIYVAQNPIDTLWADRPTPTLTQARLMPIDLVGQSSEEKRIKVANNLTTQGADLAIINQLDSICWLLNIRGGDVPRLPVLLSSALLLANGDMQLFIDSSRLPEDFDAHVGKGVSVHAPDELASALTQLAHKTVLADPQTSNAWTSQLLREHGATLLSSQDPCMLIKAAKNPTEIQGMKNAHVRDGVAICRFLAWLDSEVEKGHPHDEASLADKLYAFRKLDHTLADLSFDTISAAGGNAAMCHYRHQDQAEPGKLEINNLYLVDSGGQYPDGTTDITRTIAIGKCSANIKKTFTLVLKGHIALATARFPKGTVGSQLDALARQHLWAHGYDYDHGTGHGVGHFLSVHEGPQRISKVANNTALQPGMVLSNEPGYYRADCFGIRIENLECVVEYKTDGDMTMLGFESLTLAPIDHRLLDISLLTSDEITWWNTYHQKVWQAISPSLEGDDLGWLEKATAPLSK